MADELKIQSIGSGAGDGPLSSLETSKYDFSSTKYPSEGLGTEIPSYIVFYINLPQSGKYESKGETFIPGVTSISDQNISLSRGVNSVIQNGVKSGIALGVVKTATDVISSGMRGNIEGVGKAAAGGVVTGGVASGVGLISENIVKRPAYNRIKEAIAIYMPDTIFHTYNHDYNALSLTEALGDIGKAQRGVNALGEGMEKLGNGEVKDAIATAYRAGGAEMIGNLAEKTGVVGAGYTDVLLRSQGLALNPQVELIYKGTQNRNFIFEFKFQPKNAKESEQITGIIQKFRKYAAPDLSSSAGTYFIPPGQFDIEYRFLNNVNPFIGRISTCVLENIAVNYSSAGQFSTFNDGMPVEISLQLTFKEADIITRDMVAKQGF
ncbi:Baseplate tail-tube protein gp48, T4-like virus [uncultured Caudovirales phage]|uniref:Baseplate tail-tube protein gp48, T4-like virus n=1 Tax=uncultured Caudovirales phage TaxID=2100421 RepID=A0A6J5KV95_9CAUD|nr:Baseplate tail-tube protein gp48, T4-like virus [uncultured Caudovirales phage]